MRVNFEAGRSVGRPIRGRTAFVGAVALVLAAAGCGAGDDGNDDGAASAGDAVTVTDGTGEEVTTHGTVTSVVCLTGLCDDTLVALGLEPAASSDAASSGLLAEDYLLGDKASDIPVIGGSFGEENIEDIITAEPQLVVGLAGSHDALREPLADVAPLYLAQISSYQDSIDFVTYLGEITGTQDKAEEVIAHFQSVIDGAAAAKSDKSSLAIYGSDSDFGVDTEDGLLGSVLSQVGEYPWPASAAAEDAHQSGSGVYSFEELLAKNPDVIFVQTFSYGPSPSTPLSEQFASNPVWSQLNAVQNDKVIEVSAVVWGTGRGLLSLEQVITEATAALAS